MARMFVEGDHEALDWTGLADLAPDLPYADWRDEVLSMTSTPGPAVPAPVVCICQRLTTSAA
jgi:hypothetical protein